MIKHIVFDCDGTLIDTSKNQFRLFPGIYELLQKLHEEDFCLYIWTGRDRNSLIKILKDLKIMSFIKDFKTISDPNPKPETASLQNMLPNILGSETIIIGDSWADMLGAQKFGAYSVGAIWCPTAKKEELEHFEAQVLASSPKACYDLIQKINLSDKG